MRKHSLIVSLLAVSLIFGVFGCQRQSVTEERGMETTEIGLTEEKEPEHMKLYASCPFVYEEQEWELQTLVQEDMLVNGELALDDRGHFMIRVVSGEDSYVLFDEMVQLGMPEADVWTDEEDKLHIILRDVRTARYRVTDFTYDSEKTEFLGSHVIDGEGINYLGTTSGQ